MNLNKAQIIGRLTADPQLKKTPSGQVVTSFSVATNRSYTDKSGKKIENVDFHNLVLWGKLAEIATTYLTKGSLAYFEGRLTTRSWEDKQNVKHYTTEIVVEKMQLGPRKAGSEPARPKENTDPNGEFQDQEEVPVIDLEDDVTAEDLPF